MSKTLNDPGIARTKDVGLKRSRPAQVMILFLPPSPSPPKRCRFFSSTSDHLTYMVKGGRYVPFAPGLKRERERERRDLNCQMVKRK